GSTLTVMNPDSGKVKLNTNNGINPFKSTDLQQQSDVQGTDSDTVVINTMGTTDIMKKSKGTVGKGTYDYSLGKVGTLTLTIPDATNLEAKQYSGNVNWNLEISPDTSNTNVD
ncbi:WxL domain-containing protein, partial [Enterococcus hirae]